MTQTITTTAEITYEYAPDPGPRPAILMQRADTLLADLDHMRQQDYRILGVVLWDDCPACQGYGRIAGKAKGWRKRTPAPWYMIPWHECAACKGDGRQNIRPADIEAHHAA